jgi:hypothetical protein
MLGTKAKVTWWLAFAFVWLAPAVVRAQADVLPANEFWPKLNINFDLPGRNRLQTFVAKENGDAFGFDQFKTGVTFSHRMKRFVNGFHDDPDDERQHYLVLGVGYEYLRSDQTGRFKNENRILIEATPRYTPGAGILITDRNRAEFRWVEGRYDFRYRNKLTVDRLFKLGTVKLTPYVAGELFWARNVHAWNENQISAGAIWSHRHFLALDLYYVRQNCTSCSRDPLDVFGVTLNLFIPGKKK